MTDPVRIQRIAAALLDCVEEFTAAAALTDLCVTAAEIRELAIAASQAVAPVESVAVVWRDEDGSARAIVSGIKLLVYRCGQWRWEVSIFDGLIDRWCDGGEPMCVGLPTIDAAKAAAIAAARAWRDSIRL